MYKKIFIPISIVGAILFTGCGADTSPVGAIEKVISDKQLNSQEDVAKLITSFYKRTTISIKNTNCGKLETNSDNVIDLSIIELSNKFCKNSPGLRKEIEKTLSIININKAMNINIAQVDGTQDALNIVKNNISNIEKLINSYTNDSQIASHLPFRAMGKRALEITQKLIKGMQKITETVKNPYGIGFVSTNGDIKAEKGIASLETYKKNPSYRCKFTKSTLPPSSTKWVLDCINFYITDSEAKIKEYKKRK